MAYLCDLWSRPRAWSDPELVFRKAPGLVWRCLVVSRSVRSVLSLSPEVF